MKPKDKKKRLLLWLGGLGLYLLALALLTWAEGNDPEASIETLGDAFWYSLVTMSTVGYGDLYPVTGLGKLLGVGFVLLSVGVLTFLISVMIQIVTGKMLPALWLWLLRKKRWFVFAERNEAAFTLAKDLSREYPDGIFLFPQEDAALPEGIRCLAYPGTPESVVKKNPQNSSVFFLESSAYAQAAVAEICPVYCRTTYAPDVCPDNLTLFDPYDCCAQSYWQKHGLKEEKTIVLIGDGSCAENLLNHGLLVNVFPKGRTVSYHVFGDWANYRRNHHQLDATLAIDREGSDQDSLLFHEDAWNGDAALLARADRIILCQNDASRNLEILGQLRCYFPTHGAIHLWAEQDIPGETVFGTLEQTYTAELVMREKRKWAAKMLHQIYRDSTGGTAPGWEQLSEFLRQSNVAAADHLLTKIRILLESDEITEVTAENCRLAFQRYQQLTPAQRKHCQWIEHQRWMRFHSLYNWCYAPMRDNAARLHPLMCPFEDLSEQNQVKDDYAWELLEAIGKRI